MFKLFCFILFYFVLSSFFSTAYGTELLLCDNCSSSQRKALVLNSNNSAGPISNYYVLDSESEQLYKYTVHIEEEMGWTRVTSGSVSSSLRSSINSFFEARTDARLFLSSHPNALSDLIISVSSSGSKQSPVTSKVFTTSTSPGASSPSGSCRDSERGVYEFLTNSQFRKRIFDKMVSWYPEIQNSINAWNTFVSSASGTFVVKDKLSLTVEGTYFHIPQTISFPDGGVADVIVSEDGHTFQVVEGSAYDCNDNRIPAKEEDFRGSFTLGTRENMIRFEDYGTFFGVGFEGVCYNYNFQTTCTPKSDGNFSCSYHCN